MNLREHEDLIAKVERAKEQLVKLRKQQEELEHEKRALEELKGRQDEWYRGKKEIGETMRRALAILESEEADAQRMAVLARGARESFSGLLEQIAAVKEERWTPATLREELDKALAVLQKARKELSTARGRIPALDERGAAAGAREAPEGRALPRLGELAAGDLLRIGFWLALPAGLMAVVIIIVLSLV
ncbi:MAG: hypothetical protein PHN82_08695 [bacterium]|nr:hypothetical protein [bacterium]